MALPFVMIITAFYMLTTIGGVTITAIRLGRKDITGANQAFMHALTLTAIGGAVFTIVGTVFTDSLVNALGATGVYHEMVAEYIFWYSLFTLPNALSLILQGFGRNDNASILVMIATIVSTVLNIFLDWLFIFPLHGGIAGAAIATGISQGVSFFIIGIHFVSKRGDLKISKFKPEGNLLKKDMTRGLPEMLSQLSTPVMMVCMNAVVLKYFGNDAINAYSVISYVGSFTFAVILGVAEGMQPLFGQSYGEQNLFGADASATEMAVATLPKYDWLFMFAALNALIASYLYSTQRTKESVAVNALRGFVFIPACVWGLSILSDGSLVWIFVGIAEVLSVIASCVIVKHSERNGIIFHAE